MSKRLTTEKAFHLGQHVYQQKDDYEGKKIDEVIKACSRALGFEITEDQVLKATSTAQIQIVLPTKEERKAKKPTMYEILARIEAKIDLLLGDKP